MAQLSIILPVHNERYSIEPVLREWQQTLQKLKIDHDFIVCEDGSTDGTGVFLKKIRPRYHLILNQVKERRGYGGAVIDGIKTADTKYILSIDSDGQCDPADFAIFWQHRHQADYYRLEN